METNTYPVLSIITAVYNGVDKIRDTIESVINQTFTSIEYIIIDGKSTDGTVEVIKEYEARITTWISEPDTGIYNAMNKGIALATGKYIQFLNAGDFFLDKDILEKIFTHNYQEDILYGNYFLKRDKSEVRYFPEVPSMFEFYISSLGHQASFIKRTLFDAYQYNENYRIVSDWEFFIKKIVFENCTTRHLQCAVCYFDTSGISENSDYLSGKERAEVLNNLVPEKILADYPVLYRLRVFKNTRLYRYVLKYVMDI